MSEPLVEKAPAKINLTLRVLKRREDGYHDLESLVAFAGLADTLTLVPAPDLSLEISGPFAAACGAVSDNLVLKAAAVLRERVGEVKAGRFVLDKHIPVAGGIGGGSSDAAAALRLLADYNGVSRDDPRLASAALAVGADVPVCLDPKTRIMRGVGEVLSDPLAMPVLHAVLVNPRVPLATRDVFGALTPGAGQAPVGAPPRSYDAALDFLARYDNDLTAPAIACQPVIAEVLVALRALPGMRLVRMSGSGPTCFAVFRSSGEAGAAARRLEAERKDWWVTATTFA